MRTRRREIRESCGIIRGRGIHVVLSGKVYLILKSIKTNPLSSVTHSSTTTLPDFWLLFAFPHIACVSIVAFTLIVYTYIRQVLFNGNIMRELICFRAIFNLRFISFLTIRYYMHII